MSLVNRLLGLLLPGRCALCSAPDVRAALCPGCTADMPWLRQRCFSCGIPVPGGSATRLCERCAAGRRPAVPVMSAMAYEYPVDRLVAAAKFHGRFVYARLLGELLADSLERAQHAGVIELPQVIVPVPLHRRRLAQRGYNQALELARPVAARLRLDLRPGLVARVRPTPEQTRLSGVERRGNVRGAFEARGKLRGVRVAIVDDVLTTGSTAAAMVRALQRAGAAHCQVWTAARSG